MDQRHWGLRYGVAVGSIAVATAARMLMDPWLGDRLPFLTLFAAVVFAAWCGGVGPSLLAVVLGALAAAFFLFEPRYSFTVQSPEFRVGIVLYAFIGLGSALLFESARAAQRRAEANAREAQAKQQRLEEEVAARRRAEAAAEQQREWMQVTLASIGDAVLATDREGLVVFLNKAAQALTGWGQEEAQGMPIAKVFRIVNEDTRQPVDSPVSRVLRDGLVVGLANHTLLIARDGTERPIDDSAAPIRDASGAVAGVVLVFRDVAERRRAERVLRENEARLREQTEMLELAHVLVRDLDDRIVFWNQGAQQLYGWSREEVLGRVSHDVLHTQFPAPLDQIRSELMERGSWEGELVHRRRDGKEVVVASHWVLHRDAQGQPRTVVETNNDITERKRAEEGLCYAYEEMEARVRERTADLAAANEALRRSNRELEQFASVASHDLQEPLRKIQAFGDRLQTKYRDTLGEQGREYVERVLTAASRMRTLINDLLTFSRVTTKAQPFQPVDLGGVVSEVVADLDGRLQQTGGRVEWGELPILDADPLQMRQLLQNLIGNGLKFHKPNEPPLVRIEAHVDGSTTGRDGAVCEIRVSDNGIGFEEIYLDRIFEVFQRLHGKHEYEGTGMGLAICRKIVERHGGSITARSAPGQGATFLVTLPVRQPGEVATAP